jgi:hypothetical protein
MQTTTVSFKDQILEGIPNKLPLPKPYDASITRITLFYYLSLKTS